MSKMDRKPKAKQIVVRFDIPSFEKIEAFSEKEHRGFGEFVRHAVLVYIEDFEKNNESNKNEKKARKL